MFHGCLFLRGTGHNGIKYIAAFISIADWWHWAFNFGWKLLNLWHVLYTNGVLKMPGNDFSGVCFLVYRRQERRLQHFGTSFLKLYDQVYHHIRFGTSCRKWMICPIFDTYPLDYVSSACRKEGSIQVSPAIMLNPIEKFKSSILHLNRDWNHWFIIYTVLFPCIDIYQKI